MNFLHTLKRIFSDKGLLLTLVLSLIILIVFYGKLLMHPCTTYFDAKGDGLQIYYETLYHTKFDTEFWRQKSINYPYGESVFFTGAIPFINNLVKLFGPSAAPLGVGLLNLLMLFSPVIGALFIYAIFRHLRMPWHYGGVCASAIAFLSPQMVRFSYHYSLAWVFLIPALLFLLLRFYDFPSIKKSFLISFLVFLAATTHLYFLAFFIAIGGIYWATLFFTNDRGFGRIGFILKHTAIQFFLPLTILEILIKFSNNVTDRTNAPWGYLVYHSNLSGVFFPFFRPYEKILELFWKHDLVGLEGVAYVGLAAMLGLLAILGIQLYRLCRLRFKLFFTITDHKVLNIFFWTSILLLIISFGEPFISGHEDWLKHVGLLRQFRAVGRFSWVFFYVANIIVVYRLYKVSQRNKFVLTATLFLIPSILLFDMYYNIEGKQDALNNHIAELNDENNQLPEDTWLKNFNSNSYQAILPLPFFHIGSENIIRPCIDTEIVRQSYIVSLKTGLPLLGGISGRVSLSQTAKSIALVLNPICPYDILNDLPDQHPFLVLVREGKLDENEERLLHLSTLVANAVNYKVYSISPSTIKNIPQQQYESVKLQFDTIKKFAINSFVSQDSNAYFIYKSYDNLVGKPYQGKGSYVWKITDPSELFNSIIDVPGNYICSFWMNHVNEDLYTRLTIEVFAQDETRKAKTYYFLTDALRQIKAIDGNWGLVEFPIAVSAAGMRVQIKIWNKDMPKEKQFEFDEFMFRPRQTNLFRSFGDTIQMNNCLYHAWK